jgi:predicted GIY-YIG superfamily endonuclease
MTETVQEVAYIAWVTLQAIFALVLLVFTVWLFAMLSRNGVKRTARVLVRVIEAMPDASSWGDEATYVYHFYDVQGNLLYVGITNNVRRRWDQHAADKPWWHLVARKEKVLYSTREEAEKVEAHQIRTHRPLYNRALNGWV